MNNDREKLVQKLTDTIYGLWPNKQSPPPDDRFLDLLKSALEILDKEETIELFLFLVSDPELFFDVLNITAQSHN
jgi:hypothetical protein